MIPLSSAVRAREPWTPKNHSTELKITYAQPTTLPIDARGLEIESIMIWWKLLPYNPSNQEITPKMSKIIKPGINAENERATEEGTLAGNVMTQLLRIIKVNISATNSPIIIPEIIFAPPNQLAPTA